MAFPILEVLGAVFKPILDFIDDMTLSAEEKAAFKAQILQAQFSMYEKALDMEKSALEARAKIVEAEAKSDNWLTASWRPILMLTFGALVVARWFGLSAPGITPEIEVHLWDIIELGIGGYVIGRSAEKVVPAIATAIANAKDKE